MKVLVVLGTRPEIIRLSRVVPALERYADVRVVHTGQNADPRLKELFFSDLGFRAPDYAFTLSDLSFGGQVGKVLERVEAIMLEWRPDALLILGDTNSGLAALMGKRRRVPVCHMEAGNRCYDDRVPEELNRRVIDHSSDLLMPYSERSRQNLLQEGIPGHRIFVTGNPIYEVLTHYEPAIASADPFTPLGLERGRYLLVTMHRAENVDVEVRLRSLVAGLDGLQRAFTMPIVVSTHPRTRSFLERFGIALDNPHVIFAPAFGFLDFVSLERHAACVITDSGTVQEETAILRVPNVTIRDVTERPETLERGSSILVGCDPARLLSAVRAAVSTPPAWIPPPEYLVANVSDIVARLIVSMSWTRDGV